MAVQQVHGAPPFLQQRWVWKVAQQQCAPIMLLHQAFLELDHREAVLDQVLVVLLPQEAFGSQEIFSLELKELMYDLSKNILMQKDLRLPHLAQAPQEMKQPTMEILQLLLCVDSKKPILQKSSALSDMQVEQEYVDGVRETT